MNLSISNLSWNFSDDDAHLLMQQNNYKFLELSLTKQFGSWDNINSSLLKQYKTNLKEKYDISVCSLQSLFYQKPYNIFYDTKQFIEHFKIILNICDILDCKYVVFGSPNNRNLNGMEKEKANEIFIKTFNEIASYNTDIIIGIETNPPYYKCNYLTSYDEFKELLKNVSQTNIKFHFDLSCIDLNGDDWTKIYDYEKNNLKILHISTKDLKSIYNDKNVLTFLEIVDKSKLHTLSIEMLNQDKKEFTKCLKFLKNYY